MLNVGSPQPQTGSAIPPMQETEPSMEEFFGEEGEEIPYGAAPNGEQGENPYENDFDAGIDADEEQDPKRYIQQLTGKLSQKLRAYNSELTQPDVDLNKYVAGMINKQAVDGLSQKDVDEILKKVKADESAEEHEEPSDEDAEQDVPNQEEEPVMHESKICRDEKINELFQQLVCIDKDKDIDDGKPIQKIGYKKKPFTSPSFDED